MNILIVDDDKIIVDAIESTINWSDLGIEEIYRAYNVDMAERVLESHLVHIVVSDIEMPGNTGLELLKWYREKGYDGEFLLLTCHENFSYAADALRMQATEYLLKPCDREQLEAALKKCVLRIRERYKSKKYEEYGVWAADNHIELQRSILVKLLTQPFDESYFDRNEKLIDGESGLNREQDIVLFISRITDAEEAAEQYGRSLLRFILINICSELLFDTPDSMFTVCFENQNELFAAAVCQNMREKELTERAEKFAEYCRDRLHLTITSCNSERSRIPDMYEKFNRISKRMLSDIMVYGKFVSEKQFAEYENMDEVSFLEIDELKRYLDQRDKAGFLNSIKKSMMKLKRQTGADAKMLMSLKREVQQVCYTHLTERGIQAYKFMNGDKFYRLEKNAERSIVDIIRYVTYLLDSMFDYEEEIQKSHTLIERINAFIREHYMENISRNEVAEEFCLTPEYLSKMYKKKTGMRIQDYINENRISQARRLLENPDMSVSDVAVAVGMDNFSYFSTLYRKYTGMTPVEYRKQRGTSF